MNTISCSLELPTKSNTITKRLQHNYRNNKHKNIINNNQNYSIENGIKKNINVQENRKDNIRASHHQKYKDFEEASLDENFKLLSKYRKDNKLNYPNIKRLNPLLEGVIHFGNVYEPDCEEAERLEKTKIFNKRFMTDLDNGLLKQIEDNLKVIENEFNTTISNLVLHTDENGLNHFHFMIKNYDENGNSLNVKHNKNNIGVRVQDIISNKMGMFGLVRGKRESKTKSKSKEEYIASRELKIKNKKLEKENEILKDKNTELEHIISDNSLIVDMIKDFDNVKSEHIELIKHIVKSIDYMKHIQNPKYDNMKATQKLAYIFKGLIDGKDMSKAIELLSNKVDRQTKAIQKSPSMCFSNSILATSSSS